MRYNIKTTNLELTDEISVYLDKRLKSLDAFFTPENTAVICEVEIGIQTKHHQKGDIFRSEINIMKEGQMYRTVAIEETLYAAIDKSKDEMARCLRRGKERRIDLLRKGGGKLKKRIQGFLGR